MPSWNEIFDSVQTNNALENQKKSFFEQLVEHTGRNCIYGFSQLRTERPKQTTTRYAGAH